MRMMLVTMLTVMALLLGASTMAFEDCCGAPCKEYAQPEDGNAVDKDCLETCFCCPAFISLLSDSTATPIASEVQKICFVSYQFRYAHRVTASIMRPPAA